MTTQLIIADTSIKTDAEGRYCLNDLHKASGGEPKHRTNYWINLGDTKELVAEIEKAGIPAVSTKPGRNGGTFVVKELVYAYAMWISPAFHLKVIRAYDNLQTQGIAVADYAADELLTNPLAYFEKVLAQAKQIQAERDLALTNASEAVQKVRLLTL